MSSAVIFPGQGSQSLGMLSTLPDQWSSIKTEVFSQASDTLGFDVAHLVAEGPLERLNQTEITQPVLLSVNYILWRILREQRGQPDAVAGHSLGEFNALVAAESLSFTDALKLVTKRAELMQSAVAPGVGAMAAILGLPDDVVEAICREVAEGDVVCPANYNSPGQLVIAGDSSAVERAMLQAKQAGAMKCILLPVSVPSHCPLMAEAAKTFSACLSRVEFAPPVCAVIHNVDGAVHREPQEIREALIQQLASPVLWTASMRALVTAGYQKFIECGPGRVLTGLGKRIDKSVEWVAFDPGVEP